MSDTKVSVRPYVIGPSATSFVVPAASSFLPSSISGLVAWYDASAGYVYNDAGTTLATNGQTVQQWNDRATLGPYNMLQTNASFKPTYATTGFNSRPGVVFTLASTQAMFTVADSVAFGTGTLFSVFVVVFYTSSSRAFDGRTLSYFGNADLVDYSSVGSNAPLEISLTGGTLRTIRAFPTTYASDAVLSSGTNYRLGNIFTASQNVNYVNGVAQAGVAAYTPAAFTSPGRLGICSEQTTPSPSGGIDGTIAEIVVYNTDITSSVTSLDDYFKTKWGLS